MITEKELIIKEINSWLGTPWKHGIALKGFGTDCIQFIVAVAKTLEWLPKDFETIKYKRDWALHNAHSILEEELGQYSSKVDISNIDWNYLDNTLQTGDTLAFVFGKCASHVGIYMEDGVMMHCYVQDKVRMDWVFKYRNRLSSVWRII